MLITLPEDQPSDSSLKGFYADHDWEWPVLPQEGITPGSAEQLQNNLLGEVMRIAPECGSHSVSNSKSMIPPNSRLLGAEVPIYLANPKTGDINTFSLSLSLRYNFLGKKPQILSNWPYYPIDRNLECFFFTAFEVGFLNNFRLPSLHLSGYRDQNAKRRYDQPIPFPTSINGHRLGAGDQYLNYTAVVALDFYNKILLNGEVIKY